jgi:UPF0755 protein
MRRKITIYISASILALIFIFSIFFIIPPANYPVDTLYTVSSGTGLTAVSGDLHTRNIIRSPFYFKVFSVLFGGTKGVIAGDYVLADKEDVITLAHRLARGDFNLEPVRLTIPEGLNVMEIGKLVEQKFMRISAEDFVSVARASEGYLFPDTYLFLPNAQAEDIVKVMRENFDEKIKQFDVDIQKFNKSPADVIKMASIIEKEVRKYETMRMVAGILWRRIGLGMPLQVDASFKYVNGEGTKDLSLEDLKIDSPYNSYLYKGLPPTPISNPGLDAIRATINPAKTDYLYFLTGRDGKMHYAKTFAGHLQNKQMYLK